MRPASNAKPQVAAMGTGSPTLSSPLTNAAHLSRVPAPTGSTQAQSLDLQEHLLKAPRFFVYQKKSWWQMLTDFEARNKYTLLTEHGHPIGTITEQSGGFLSLLSRLILKSHRPFHLVVADMNGRSVLQFKRKFFFFFSDIEVLTPNNIKLGSAHRRFGFLRKKYDLRSPTGETFARIRTFIFRIWTFKIFDMQNNERALITKKWGGALREAFSDADRFLIDYGQQPWKAHERAVILSVAMSIDFDFFERNSGGIGSIFGG